MKLLSANSDEANNIVWPLTRKCEVSRAPFTTWFCSLWKKIVVEYLEWSGVWRGLNLRIWLTGAGPRQWRHFSKSLGVLGPGVSVGVKYCSCSSNTVSKDDLHRKTRNMGQSPTWYLNQFQRCLQL